MWWSRRILISALLMLAACELRPLHMAPAGATINEALATIEVSAPKTPVGQQLATHLIDDLNPAGVSVESRYRLEVSLERTRTALAIQLDDRITRYDLTLAAFFRLISLEEDRTIYRSAVRRVASYNVVREPFATLIAEQDAERRAAIEISRQIRTLLAVRFAERAP